MKKLANLSFGSALTFLILLTLLHFIEPEFNPSWHFISEYELGSFGWIMSLAFFLLGLSCIALALALWQQLNISGRIGLLILMVSAVGMIIAAICITDPLNTKKELWTEHGKLHQLGATLDGLPIAALLIVFNLIRKNQIWRKEKIILICSTILVWAGMIVFIVSMAKFFPKNGIFGPGVSLGWPNRFMIAVQAVWLAVISHRAIRFNEASSINQNSNN